MTFYLRFIYLSAILFREFEIKFADTLKGFEIMDVRVGDKLLMKKQHPCGNNEFLVLRSGMDFKLKCSKCGHEIMVARNKIEKSIKKIIRED